MSLLALLMMLVVSSSALGATPGTSYGAAGNFGAADLTGVFGESSSVAVDPSGRIFVADTFTNDIKVYAPDALLGGTLLTTIPFGALPFDIAVDPTTGALYATDGGGVVKFVPDSASPPNYAPDPSFSTPVGYTGAGAMAVDPTSHDLLVGNGRTHSVDRLSPTGALLSSYNGSDTTAGALASPASVAVGLNGDIYVVESAGPTRLERFNSAGVSLGRLPIRFPARWVATNPATGEVVVAENRFAPRPTLEGFDATGAPTFSARYLTTTGGGISGLAVSGATDRIYSMIPDGSTSSWQVEYFDRAVQPGVDAPAVSQITTQSAHLTAAVAAGASATTTARFEYCPTTANCEAFPYSDSTATDGSGQPNPWQLLPDHSVPPSPIADDLNGLLPNQTYRVRTYATNGTTESISAAVSFKTPAAAPDATTGVASEARLTDAVLNGTINPEGAQTTYHFEYGTTTAYDLRTPQAVEAVAGNGRTTRSVGRTVGGLLPAMTYHFRLVAQNAGGTTYGADRTFTTAATDAPVRGYEQVSPVDKRGAAINPVYGFHMKADGSALEYALSAAGDGAQGAALTTRVMSRRESSDWTDWNYLDPPLDVMRTAVGSTTLAVSSDFGHVLVATNRQLTGEGIAGALNLYVKDLGTGVYTFVGQSTAPGALNRVIGLEQSNVYLAGAPDFSWLVFQSVSPMSPGAPNVAMYRWTPQGGLTLISRLPDGSVPNGDIGVFSESQGPARFVSDDGDVTTFAVRGGGGVYRRAHGQTAAISVSRVPGDPTTPRPGLIAAMSRDGDAVIFQSGRLLSAAPASDNNLYQYRASTDALTYLGSLASSLGDVHAISDDGNAVYFTDDSGALTAYYDGAARTVPDGGAGAGSANGRFYVWIANGDGYRYDVRSGTTVCATCKADGSPGGDPLVSFPFTTRNISNQVPMAVADDGTAYFTTTARLVVGDHNARRDVYAYRDGGPVLISPGDAAFDANFAGATEDGRNVFFSTAESLVGQDQDGAYDIYDSRLGGGFPGQSPIVPAPCQKATCGPATSGPVTSPPVGDPPRPASPPAKRTNQAKAKVSLRKLTFTPKAMHVTFVASQHGRVRVIGTNIAITVRDLKQAGTYTVVVPLSKKAQGLRRRHKRFKVTAKVAFTGGWTTASFKINRTIRG